MVEGLLKSDVKLRVFSAGTNPSQRVDPFAVRAMKEIGIDMSTYFPKNVDQFISKPFDWVITVCDSAKETCPVFLGLAKHRLHFGFEDPAEGRKTDDEIFLVFRRVRDEIKKVFHDFYTKTPAKE